MRENGSAIERPETCFEKDCDFGTYEWWPAQDRLIWSPGLLRVYGLKREPAGEQDFLAIVHPEDRLRVEAETSSFLGAGASNYSHSFRVLRPDGGVRLILDRGVIERDENGVAQVLRGFNVDLTDQHHRDAPPLVERSEGIENEALRREVLYQDAPRTLSGEAAARPKCAAGFSDDRYRLLAQTTGAVTWTCPPSGLHVTPQPDWMAFTGQSAEEMLGDGWTRAVHPDDLAAAASSWRNAVAGGRAYESQHRIRRFDGAWRWISVRAVPIRKASGEVVEWFGMNIDITTAREGDAARQKSEARLSLAQNAAGLGIHDFDVRSGTIEWDDRVRKLWGVSPDEPIGYDTFMAGVHPEDRAATQAAVDRALDPHGNGSYYAEYRVRSRQDNAVRWIAATGKVTFDNGTPIRLVGTVQDVTDRKEAEESLQERNRQLDLLGRISRRLLVDNGPVQNLLEAIFSDIADHIGVESFYHYRPTEPRRLRLEVAFGVTEEARRKFAVMGFGELLCGRVAQTRKSLIVEDLQHSAQPGAEVLRDAGGTSYAGFPLVVDEELIGTIAFVSSKRTHFRDGDLRTIQAICDQIAVTLKTRRLHHELQESEERYRGVFRHADMGIAIRDLNGRYQSVNPAYSAMFGYGEQELQEFDFIQLVHPEDRESNMMNIRRLLAGEIPSFEIVNRSVRKDGEIIWLDRHVSLLRDSTGQPSHIIGLVTDVTDRRKAEEALAAAHWELQNIIDNMPAVVYAFDLEGRFVMANRAIAALFDATPEQLIGKKRDELMPDDDADQHETNDERAIAAGGALEFEELSHLPGRSITWLTTKFPLRDAQRRIYAVAGISIDISGRKQAEESLRAAHDAFRDLVDRSPFGVYAVNADFRLVQVSEGARKVFGNVRPLIGRDFAEVLRTIWPEPFATEAIGRFRHTLATGEPYHSPSTVEQRADIGVREAYDWKIEQLTLPDGRAGVVCHFYDLSERQRYEERINLLMREVNHRSKNMLALVLSIARQTAAAGTSDFVDRFTDRLRALAASQDLLVKHEWTVVPLADLVSSQLAHFVDLIGDRISVSGPVLSVTPAAAQTLGMALHELATNAAKYGALSATSGRITIAWHLETDEKGQPQFMLSWVEQGGPPVEQPQRLGFGSSVTSRMVEMSLAGKVEMNFAPSGLVWRLACPADRVLDWERTDSRRDKVAPPKNASSDFKRILVVEDEPVVALEVAAMLEAAGFTVLGPATSVEQALALIERSTCEAAILDVNLGNETAEPVARRLSLSGIPFLTISGYSREQLPVGFRLAPLLAKPLNPALVVTHLRRCLAGERFDSPKDAAHHKGAV